MKSNPLRAVSQALQTLMILGMNKASTCTFLHFNPPTFHHEPQRLGRNAQGHSQTYMNASQTWYFLLMGH